MNGSDRDKASKSLGSRSRALEHTLLQQLDDAFSNAGWAVEAERGSADLLVRSPDGRFAYAVELKSWRDGRRDLLPALLARAFLQAQRYASEAPGLRPLAVVGAPHISRALGQELREFAERFLPGNAYGWIDARGQLRLFGHGLDGVQSREDAPQPLSPHVLPARSFPLFSDLNQWMLKVLLAYRLPPALIQGGSERPLNARHLATIAGTSVPSASRLVAYLLEADLLERRSGGLELVQREALLSRWRQAMALPVAEQHMRWMLPGRAPSAERLWLGLQAYQSSRSRPTQLREERPRACLGLFAACDRLGLSHVRGVPPHLYLEDFSESAFTRLALRPCHPGEAAEIVVRKPRAPEALYRACVELEGVLVADVVQCWLDVSSHPARGEEQARHLETRVLRGTLLEPGGER